VPAVSSYTLEGKVAFITGAGRGIGFETARLMHARGASVALVDLQRAEVERAAAAIGERTLALEADVTDRDAIEAAVAATVERFGGLDVPVANAGIAPPTRTVRSIDPEAFERTIEVNLLGVWRTVRVALPHVIERGGHVVVVASVYAFLNGALATPYAMSKGGVEQLGRALRSELSVHGASASVAYFGFIDTEMVRSAFTDPIASELESLMPKFALRRLKPAQAGEAIVRGVERRAPRIVAPRWWSAWMALRGVANPLFDARFERDRRLQDIVRRADAASSSAAARLDHV
jgi:NAD(P)-dependent dehydrogenase (short-subunit alcohol dehydrogenase family)